MKHKILEKCNILILSLDGNIGREDKEALTQCSKEVTEKEFKSVVIYFQNVTTVDPQVFRELTLIQFEIRKKNLPLRIVGLNLPMKLLLSDRGVIRSGEVFNDIREVLINLSKVQSAA